MARRKYSTRASQSGYAGRRRTSGFPVEKLFEYLQLRKQYPLGEMNAHCTKGMNGGRCSACLIQTLRYWQVDVKVYFREVAQARREARKKYLEEMWGMSDPDYEAMYYQQEGRCALCGEEETRHRDGVMLALAVDHSHVTGKIRGLLCSRCNVALGHIETHGLQWTRKAVQYLKAYMSKTEIEKFRR